MIEQKRPIQYSNIRIDFMQRFRLSVSTCSCPPGVARALAVLSRRHSLEQRQGTRLLFPTNA